MKIVALNWRDLAHPLAGGAEIVIDRVLTGLADRGHDVSLVCGGPVAPHDYEVVDAGGTYSQYLRVPWIGIRRFHHADLLIDSENGVPYFTPLWRRGASICLVHHVHTDQWATRFPRPVAFGARAIEQHLIPAVYRRRLFIAVSASTASALDDIGVSPARIRVIESGVDVPSGPLASKSPEPLFVTLTRLVPHKRVDLLLEAWRMAQPVTGGRFVVMGAGPELAALRNQAGSLPGAEVRGWVEDDEKDRLLAEAWFLVHGAHHEGWGMAIMEAAAVGTPALVADAPGVRDSVVNGVTGVVVDVPENDVVQGLAREWIALASDAGRRANLANAARRRAEGYAWDRVIDKWVSVANEACAPLPRKIRDRTTTSKQPPQNAGTRAKSAINER